MATITITSTDRTRIAVHVSGEGPPLVLVHGGTADHTRWGPLLPRLEPHATVYAIDRRGRGGSGDAVTYHLEREFEDVAAVVADIATTSGGPVDLLGHSFGAICAIGGARLADGSLRRLVLYEPPIGPAGILATRGLLERLEDLLAQDRRDEMIETFLREEVQVPPESLSVMRSRPAWQARIAAAHTLPRELRAVAAFDPSPPWVGAVTVPALLLLGGDSPSAMREGTQFVHRHLPDARIGAMPGQQHVAMDTAPEMFTQLVLEFLGDDRGPTRHRP